MLNLEVLISNNYKLYKTLEKTKKRRYTLKKRNIDFLVKSKHKRTEALEKEYPLSVVEKQKKRFMLLCILMKIRTMLSGVKVVEFNSYKKKSNKPVIFVPTHIGKYDIEVVYECIKEHALLLSGTEDRMHGSLNGFFLEKNGVNYVDRSDKEDRKNAVKKMERDLENGVNLLWFIEGTWNLSENQLIYDTSYAVIKMSIEHDVEIVPIGLNQDGKTIFVNFGEGYKPDKAEELTESIQKLRDKMASLKWELYEYCEAKNRTGMSVDEYKNMPQETYFCTRRSELDENYWADYVSKRVKEWPMTDLLEECEFVYKPKDDAHRFFDEFNSNVITLSNGEKKVKRI